MTGLYPYTYFSTFVKDYIRRITKGLNFCFHAFLFPNFYFRRFQNAQQHCAPYKTCATTQCLLHVLLLLTSYHQLVGAEIHYAVE